MDLTSCHSVQEFFHEAVTAAMRNQGVESSDLTEFYLVNLLSDFTKSALDDTPLAIKLRAAATALPEERAQKLRDVGDQSLYVSGFFSDSLSRGLVDVDYYIELGGTAYRQLAGMRGRSSLAEVYIELAGNFSRFVDVLAEVSKGSSLTSDRGVVDLYERWLKTGSGWIERKLRAQGVLPSKGKGDLH